MPGHSGEFNIDWNGVAQIKGKKPYKIKFSDNFTTDQAWDKEIEITSPDGYKYIFGGSLNTTESSSFFPDGKNIMNQELVETAWFLRKIIAPNKREVEFVYRQTATPRVSPKGYNQGHESLILSKGMISSSTVNTKRDGEFLFTIPLQFPLNPLYFTYELLRQAYLEKIIIDKNTTVEFNYKEELKTFYTSSELEVSFYPFNKKNLLLSSIEVKYGNVPIKEITFNQELLGENSKTRTFLTKLITDDEEYRFEYYNLDKIPDRALQEIDHWGYYNGVKSIIPERSFSERNRGS